MYTPEQLAKIRWGCRRGMLELDVILLPFFNAHFESLTVQQQQNFVDLLEEADPDIFSWLMGYSEPSATFKDMIALIQHKHQQIQI